MTGRLSDLNAHLFDALDRLAKDNLTGTALADEVDRAEAIVKVADQITANHRTALAAAGLFAQHGTKVMDYLPRVDQINARTQEVKPSPKVEPNPEPKRGEPAAGTDDQNDAQAQSESVADQADGPDEEQFRGLLDGREWNQMPEVM